MISTTEKRDID